MTRIGKELKRCRNHLRMTLPEMAKKMNVSTTTIVNYETGKRLPEVDFLIDFAGICERDFLYWIGLRVAESQSVEAGVAKTLLDTANLAQKTEQPYVALPLYDINNIADAASATAHKHITDFSETWIRRELNVDSSDLFMIQVDDESMTPALRSGDTLLLDRRAARPDREGVYILRMNGVSMIKRLQILPSGIIKASSDNPAYENFDFNLSDIDDQNISILGRVVWVVWAGRRI